MLVLLDLTFWKGPGSTGAPTAWTPSPTSSSPSRWSLYTQTSLSTLEKTPACLIKDPSQGKPRPLFSNITPARASPQSVWPRSGRWRRPRRSIWLWSRREAETRNPFSWRQIRRRGRWRIGFNEWTKSHLNLKRRAPFIFRSLIFCRILRTPAFYAHCRLQQAGGFQRGSRSRQQGCIQEPEWVTSSTECDLTWAEVNPTEVQKSTKRDSKYVNLSCFLRHYKSLATHLLPADPQLHSVSPSKEKKTRLLV